MGLPRSGKLLIFVNWKCLLKLLNCCVNCLQHILFLNGKDKILDIYIRILGVCLLLFKWKSNLSTQRLGAILEKNKGKGIFRHLIWKGISILYLMTYLLLQSVMRFLFNDKSKETLFDQLLSQIINQIKKMKRHYLRGCLKNPFPFEFWFVNFWIYLIDTRMALEFYHKLFSSKCTKKIPKRLVTENRRSTKKFVILRRRNIP